MRFLTFDALQCYGFGKHVDGLPDDKPASSPSPLTRLPHGVGCRPPGGNVRYSALVHWYVGVVWLFSVGYRRRNRPAVGCLPSAPNLKLVNGLAHLLGSDCFILKKRYNYLSVLLHTRSDACGISSPSTTSRQRNYSGFSIGRQPSNGNLSGEKRPPH